MKSIEETAESIYDAIHGLFGRNRNETRESVIAIQLLIEHFRARLDTEWIYLLGKIDSTVYRLDGYLGKAPTGMSPEDDLHFAFADWTIAKRNLDGVTELPRATPKSSYPDEN